MTYASASASLSGLPDPRSRPDVYQGTILKRGLAWVFDTVLIALLSVLILPFTAFTALFFFPVLMLVVGFLYRWSTLAGGSSTWGMRLMAVELREADGGPLRGTTALLHTAGYTISIAVFPLQLVSIVLMLLSERGQGLTDHILGTAAVNRLAR